MGRSRTPGEGTSRSLAGKVAPPGHRKKIVLSALIIVLLGCSVYWSALDGQLLWDDEFLVRQNTFIKDWSHVPQIFTQHIGAGAGEPHTFYRPLQIFTYLIDHSFWKLNARGYHLTNILLHCSAALCLYGFLFLITKDNGLAFLGGAFFVVHPVHTEAVSYIAGRADTLALLFMLMGLIFYIMNPSTGRAGVYVLMSVSYTLALLSKESSLILPLFVWIYHDSFRKQVRAGKFLLIVGLAGAYVVMRLTVFRAMLDVRSYSTTFLQRLPGFFVAFTNYVRLLFFPFDLHMEYKNPLFSWGDPKAVLGVILLGTLCLYAVRERKKDPLVYFAIAWFFLALIPVSNLYPINAYMAEHWLYVPSIGFFIILAKGLNWLYLKNERLKILAVVVTVTLLGYYSFLTVRQNRYWKDPIRFFEQTLSNVPDSARAYNNLGVAYRDSRQYEQAAAAFRTAITMRAAYEEAYNNLGVVYTHMDRVTDAIAAYQQAIKINAEYAPPYNNLGEAFSKLGRMEDAVAAYQRAIGIKKDYAEAFNNLGNAYQRLGRFGEAANSYKKAVAINGSYSEALYNLGNLHLALDEEEEALRLYDQAIRIDPGYVPAYNNKGIVYYKSDRLEEAQVVFRKAIELDPGYFDAYYNLGNIYYRLDKYEEAIVSYQKTIQIKPDYPKAHHNLAVIFLDRKQYKKAIDHYERAKAQGFDDPVLRDALVPFR